MSFWFDDKVFWPQNVFDSLFRPSAEPAGEAWLAQEDSSAMDRDADGRRRRRRSPGSFDGRASGTIGRGLDDHKITTKLIYFDF